MSPETLAYVLFGFIVGFTVMALDKFFTVGALIKHYKAIAERNRESWQLTADDAYDEGYAKALRDVGRATSPTNEAGGALPVVGATLIPEDKEARPDASTGFLGQTNDFEHYFGKDQRNA